MHEMKTILEGILLLATTNIDASQVNLVTNSLHERIWRCTFNIVLQLIIPAIANHTGYTQSSIM